MAELHLYDFDGTLFRSPHEPEVWNGDWWNDVQSLMPPCIPEVPGPDWWISSTVTDARRSISDQDVYAVLATGRGVASGLRYRVPELLKQKGLHFDEVHLAPSSGTLSWKKGLIRKILKDHPIIDTVRIWDDRSSHIPEFVRAALSAGILMDNIHATAVRARSKDPECPAPGDHEVSPVGPKRPPAYVGVFLSASSRAALADVFPYAFHKAEGGHMTLSKKVTPDLLAMVGSQVRLRVVGVAQNDRVQAAVVSLPSGITSDNETPHVTLSHVEGASPKESNDMLRSTPLSPVTPMILQGVIDVFPRSLVPSAARVAAAFSRSR